MYELTGVMKRPQAQTNLFPRGEAENASRKSQEKGEKKEGNPAWRETWRRRKAAR